jgi:hypothetical protein
VSFAVGDRVMLVWGCCPRVRSHIGLKGTVRFVYPTREVIHSACRTKLTTAACDLDAEFPMLRIPVSWLIKLPPDEVSRTTQELEEVNA